MYKTRIIEERYELAIKLAKLEDFINGKKYEELSFAEKYYLRKQKRLMSRYLDTLDTRLVFAEVSDLEASQYMKKVNEDKLKLQEEFDLNKNKVENLQAANKSLLSQITTYEKTITTAEKTIAFLKNKLEDLAKQVEILSTPKEVKEKVVKPKKTVKDGTKTKKSKTNE